MRPSRTSSAITVNSAGQIFIGEEKYTLGEFRVVFRGLSQNRTKNGVYLRADKGVDYGIVVQLLAIMNANGVSNVGLVTEPEEIR